MRSPLHRLLATGLVTLALIGGVGCSTSTPWVESSPTPSSTQSRAETRDATALIVSSYPEGHASGSGSVLTSDGKVLTNNHVIADATAIQVQVGDEFYSAHLIVTFPDRDVALIQLEDASGLPTVTIGDSDTVQVGDTVTAIGNSEGIGKVVLLPGEVVAIDQTLAVEEEGLVVYLTGAIQVGDRVIYPGNSGGPLVNADDEVIGMNTAGSNTGVTEGFAIPINQAMVLIRSYLESP